MAKRKRRVALGKPLPPADDIEFDAETMRQWAYNQAKVHAEKYAPAAFVALLGAETPEDDIIDNA
jgi:hypothetical protein